MLGEASSIGSTHILSRAMYSIHVLCRAIAAMAQRLRMAWHGLLGACACRHQRAGGMQRAITPSHRRHIRCSTTIFDGPLCDANTLLLSRPCRCLSSAAGLAAVVLPANSATPVWTPHLPHSLPQLPYPQRTMQGVAACDLWTLPCSVERQGSGGLCRSLVRSVHGRAALSLCTPRSDVGR